MTYTVLWDWEKPSAKPRPILTPRCERRRQKWEGAKEGKEHRVMECRKEGNEEASIYIDKLRAEPPL
ncbi:hypothetical protein CBOM_02770 [Ceraceosorus bombacis]|uniref:Uncharacterized protein n=1 Tax=Ceraceosorus bombacis TaxID=401625 RepID=A0A0P1BG56_9BASI|nr:hypothetical protein CBOM_02770 [Ceraceosorus bombacis]